MATIHINDDKLQDAAGILRALAHNLRLEILDFIDKNDTINVNKIYNTLNLEQSITSQHLRILRLAKLVDTQRDGKFIYYSIDYEKVQGVKESISRFLTLHQDEEEEEA